MADCDGREAASSRNTAEPAEPSRRSVLRGAAGAGAAGLAATALTGIAIPASAGTRPARQSHAAAAASQEGSAATEPVIVHVRDAASGEIDVFRGTTQTRLHDRELAARLVRASR